MQLSASDDISLRQLMQAIDRFDAKETEIVIDGSIYADLSRTYVAVEKMHKDKANGKVAVVAGILGSVAATIFTAGLMLPAALVTSGAAFAGGANAMVGAIREFKGNPYADEVFLLYERGYRVNKNSNGSLVLRHKM